MHGIFPYLFQREAEDTQLETAEDSYLTDNKRAIFITSRHFSELESHALIMRPDYLGEVLVKSGVFASSKKNIKPKKTSANGNRSVKRSANSSSVSNEKSGEADKGQLTRAKNGIQPYFNSIFTRKITVYSKEDPVSKRAKSGKKKLTSAREIETRFLFTAIEIRNCWISKQKIERVVNTQRFPNLRHMVFDNCGLTPQLFEKLAIKMKITHLVLRECNGYVGSFRTTKRALTQSQCTVFATQIAKMKALISLRVEGGDSFFTTAPPEWNMSNLQNLQFVEQKQFDQLTLLLTATKSKIQELSLENTHLSSLEGITMPGLRRLNLNGTTLDVERQIMPFIRRHPLLEEILLESGSRLEPYEVTVELIQAIISCKHIKRLNFCGCTASYEAIKVLAEANLELEELNLYQVYVPGVENITAIDFWLLLAQMKQLKKLEGITFDQNDDQEATDVIDVLTQSLTQLEFFSYHVLGFSTYILKILQRLTHLKEVNFSGPLYIEAFFLLKLMREKKYIQMPSDWMSIEALEKKEFVTQLASETILNFALFEKELTSEIDETILNRALRVRPFLTTLCAANIEVFTDQVIKQMAEQTLLETVDLRGTPVTANGVSELLRKCPHLTELGLPILAVLELGSMSQQMSKIKKLYISYPASYWPSRGATIEAVLKVFPNVEILDLESGIISLDVVRQLGYFEALQAINFGGKFEQNAAVLFEFLGLKKQIQLKLKARVVLTDAEFSVIERFQEGSILDASILPKKLFETLDDELIVEAIRRRPNLTTLILTNASGFTDTGIDALENMEQLTEIDLSGTSVTYLGVQKLVKKCPQLKNITLSYTADFNRAAQSMQGAKNVRSLHILKGSQVQIQLAQMQLSHMQQIAKSLPQLTVLGLYGLQLTQKGVIAAVCQNLQLQTLFLNESSISTDTFRELINFSNTSLSNTLRAIDITQVQFPPYREAPSILETLSIEHMMTAFSANYREQYIASELLVTSKGDFLKAFAELMPHCQVIVDSEAPTSPN